MRSRNPYEWFEAYEQALHPQAANEQARTDLARFALINSGEHERRSEVAGLDPDADLGPPGGHTPADAEEARGLAQPADGLTRLVVLLGVLTIASLAILFG